MFYLLTIEFTPHILDYNADHVFECLFLFQANNTDAIVAAKKVAANCARSVYMDAIDANPGVTLLRCALAELEEGAGTI